MPTVTIDPTNPKKEHRAILAQLLTELKNDAEKKVLKRSKFGRPIIHKIIVEGVTWSVKLTHSISKPFDPLPKDETEFYIRTKQRLGAGGFGLVKKATHRLKLKHHNIDVLPGMMVYKRIKYKDILAIYPERKLENFKKHAQQEVDILNERYPNLNIQLIERGEEDKYSVHFFMPFIPGESLEQFDLVKGSVVSATRSSSMDKKLSYARQLFRDLASIHARNIAHLDVKNANMLITKRGQLRLIDFGLAQPFNTNLSGKIGTKRYRAPEISYQSGLDLAQADMYSTFLSFYSIITGKDGPSETYPINKENGKRYFESRIAEQDLKKSTSNAIIGKVFYSVLNNLRSIAGKRLTAPQAELLMGVLSSKLFESYSKDQQLDFIQSIKSNASNYSLQDLFYLISVSHTKKEELTLPVDILFDNDDFQKRNPDKVDNFLKAIFTNQSRLEKVYKEKLSEQLKALSYELEKCNEKSPAIRDLIKFITSFIKSAQAFDLAKFDELVLKIQNVLQESIETQFGKKTGSTVIEKILNGLDPFILEQISPAILEQSYALEEQKATLKSKLSNTFANLFTKKSTEVVNLSDIEIPTSTPKKPS